MQLSVTTTLVGLFALTASAADTNSTKSCNAIGYICPKTYAPVCGSNGRTYDTECDLKSVQCETDDLKIQSTGPCYTCKTTGCPKTLDPVCGSDHKTYDNECALVLAKCSGVDVAREYFGKCNSTASGSSDGLVTVDCKALTCKAIDYWAANGAVCGSDNKTYDNDCALHLAMCASTTLRKQYDGMCPNEEGNATAIVTPSPTTAAPDSAAVGVGGNRLLAVAVAATALATLVL